MNQKHDLSVSYEETDDSVTVHAAARLELDTDSPVFTLVDSVWLPFCALASPFAGDLHAKRSFVWKMNGRQYIGTVGFRLGSNDANPPNEQLEIVIRSPNARVWGRLDVVSYGHMWTVKKMSFKPDHPEPAQDVRRPTKSAKLEFLQPQDELVVEHSFGLTETSSDTDLAESEQRLSDIVEGLERRVEPQIREMAVLATLPDPDRQHAWVLLGVKQGSISATHPWFRALERTDLATALQLAGLAHGRVMRLIESQMPEPPI